MNLFRAAKAGHAAFKLFRRARKRRKLRKARKKGLVSVGEIDAEVELEVQSIKGAFKSKLVWLGIIQEFMGLFELYANGGDLNSDAVTLAVAGALTILFRAVTTKPLSEK